MLYKMQTTLNLVFFNSYLIQLHCEIVQGALTTTLYAIYELRSDWMV